MKREFGFWSIQLPGWLLLCYLFYAQAIPAFDYDIGVAIGLIGYGLGRLWGRVLLATALGVTVYSPVVCLSAVSAARDAVGWNLAQLM